MSNILKITLGVALGIFLFVGACSALVAGSVDVDDPLPTGSDAFPTERTKEVAASTCDVAREALLTGSQDDIKAAMRALQTDMTANATAREAANDYLNGYEELRDANAMLVRTYCSL